MALFKPDPPQPPNPIQTATAQTGTNVSTAVANAFLNNVNQSTPQGSLNYNVTGDYNWTDPSTGQTYNIPTFTAQQTLSPNQQYSANQSEQAQMRLAELARVRGGQLYDQLSNPINVGAAPQGGSADWLGGSFVPNPTYDIGASGQQQQQMQLPATLQQLTYADAGPLNDTFADAGDITRSYGPADSFSADRARVEQAMFERLDPQLQQDEARLRQQLADQGIRYGSQAYEDAMRTHANRVTDTRLGITAQGGTEQQRLMDMAAKQAGFQNAAQQQAYQQALGRGEFFNKTEMERFNQLLRRAEFGNQAQQQQFAQNLQTGQFANEAQRNIFAQNQARANFFNNAAVQQQARGEALFNAANAQRNQYMQEQYALRNQPLNEISALLSGSQVQNPQWLNTPQSQIPTTDIGGLINSRFAQDMSIYNSQNQNFQQLMGGIFGAIGGVGRGYLSDVRAKENIGRIGTVFAANENGEQPLPIYEYSYKADPTQTRRVGPMAQDVEKIAPRAVTTKRGVKYIDKTKLGSILKVA